jgi:ribosome modulation factor
LDDEGDITALGVRVGDGERYALSPLVDAKDDELAGLALLRYARSDDAEELHIRGEESGFEDRKQEKTPFQDETNRSLTRKAQTTGAGVPGPRVDAPLSKGEGG